MVSSYIGTSGQRYYRRIRIARFIQDKKISEIELYIKNLKGIQIEKVR